MFFDISPGNDEARAAMRQRLHADEESLVEALIEEARLEPETGARVTAEAARLAEGARRRQPQGLDAFLREYSLSSPEGVVLMCLAEALLRIPDVETRERLIRDKLAGADWARHLGRSRSLLVNASTWALMLTGRLIRPDEEAERDPSSFWRRLVARSGEPAIREALGQAMRIMSRQFVAGATINDALSRTQGERNRGYCHSFDMLGEAARTGADAERFEKAYAEAIEAVAVFGRGLGPVAAPGISVKLSALHPRYEAAQADRIRAELAPRLAGLAQAAAAADIGLCVDAEEADRLELSLEIIAYALQATPRDWDGFGMAIQAYQKRAPLVIDWIAETARSQGRRIQVRLVKGAYWDAEIKRAQELGLDGYPVFTRKASTDVAYIAAARRLAGAGSAIYAQFATHNAHTVAAVQEVMASRRDYEFQRLHGMGEDLYEQLVGQRRVRIYAPVGNHQELLPYLVRRLLENGSNNSFVNRLADQATDVARLTADPVARMRRAVPKAHPRIPLPVDLFRPERVGARGYDLADPATTLELDRAVEEALAQAWESAPVVGGMAENGVPRTLVFDPADRSHGIGTVVAASTEQVARAVVIARASVSGWDELGGDKRAAILERAADLFETDAPALIAHLVREAGKTVGDSVAEVRETVDFLRYYAVRAREDFLPDGLVLPGPTGEANRLFLHGRGVFVCLSPWNFPLSIFTGQVAAALAAGNAVLAKPAEQTPLIAARAVALLIRAGVPGKVLHLLPGDGALGARLVADKAVAGVAFTGSTETARSIRLALAEKEGPIVPLIAETGGINAMIVDSSALPEQVVRDVLISAFQSAGQRCSALRVLYVQDDIADKLTAMLKGAMDEMVVGDPGRLATDVGPVIDEAARASLEDWCRAAGERVLHQLALPPACAGGTFFPPTLIALEGLAPPGREVFGPVLHLARFKASQLDRVIDAIAETGYGLTLGIESRIDSVVRAVVRRLPVGNVYVNRSMIGAAVGVQPFGGEGLSGTGPKAGGPRYLHRFAVERCLSINTAAGGGNVQLLNMDEED